MGDEPEEAGAERETVASLEARIRDILFSFLGRFPAVATRNDRYLAVAYAVRERVLQRGVKTAQTYWRKKSRTVCYLSAEYLLGPLLASNVLALDILDELKAAVAALGWDYDEILAQEEEPGLGNGGLGRLAACYIDSLATREIPSIAYGIRYEFGIFDQRIRDGWQVEVTDKWLHLGNPWEVPRAEIAFAVSLGGRTEAYLDAVGRYRVRWIPHRVIKGVPYDTAIPGHGVPTVNLLRLFKAEAIESFDMQAFNQGDYWGAVDDKMVSENVTKILYPNDEVPPGKALRLEQQYFFVTCALQDVIRIYLQRDSDMSRLNEKYAIQLNDTHPALAVAELMRLLVDEHDLDWDTAWDVTTKTFGYTNHTLLPEALETWSVELFGTALPRHLEIVYEINRRFLDEVRSRFPGDEARVARMSLIDEAGGRSVRMAHLATVGSHTVNGVAKLHSRLLQTTVLSDFYALHPERFTNVTNGVTPRRFLRLINPGLSALVTEAVGEGWESDLGRLAGLERLAFDAAFRERFREVKRANKEALARDCLDRAGVLVDPASLFDIQVKRFHEYKRQHLNILHVVTLWRRLREGRAGDVPPRTVLFAGKAAPGYRMAKLIIKLIHEVAAVVNADPKTRDSLRVAFLPDYNVKNSQRIFPAAELSEQISTSGKEASGTGNMKLAMNGALTIGTLDGANVEIREAVGAESFFLFGLNAAEVAAVKAAGYRPRDHYERDAELKEAVDLVASGTFSRGDDDLFRPLVDDLLNSDAFLVLADYRAYLDAQVEVGQAYGDADAWTRSSVLNVARMGSFSSDRAIDEYCERIWRVGKVSVDEEASDA